MKAGRSYKKSLLIAGYMLKYTNRNNYAIYLTYELLSLMVGFVFLLFRIYKAFNNYNEQNYFKVHKEAF